MTPQEAQLRDPSVLGLQSNTLQPFPPIIRGEARSHNIPLKGRLCLSLSPLSLGGCGVLDADLTRSSLTIGPPEVSHKTYEPPPLDYQKKTLN